MFRITSIIAVLVVLVTPATSFAWNKSEARTESRDVAAGMARSLETIGAHSVTSRVGTCTKHGRRFYCVYSLTATALRPDAKNASCLSYVIAGPYRTASASLRCTNLF